MVLFKPIIAVFFFFILLDSNADCNDSPASSNNDDASSIPMIASGKRMHNIMRFGKRPAGGHSLIHFGKRENSKPQHSFLYFGKRENYQGPLPDLLQYLQNSQDGSSKRGHSIMRFGKREDPANNNFIGGPEEEDSYDGYVPNEGEIDEDKRGGHSMMYFGKRGGHNMMYFGKRGGHSMMYFGKRAPGHNILSFGKRDEDKRAHSMIHFGKREDDENEDGGVAPEDKRGGHSMLYFGKREDGDSYQDDAKRASHSMIHFGKRDFEDEPVPFFWNPAASDKELNIYRYGKKAGPKNNHAMIHFGKRDDDKRAHSMIHFGKRSVEQNDDDNQTESSPTKAITRMKRDLEEVGSQPLMAMAPYESGEVMDVPDDDIESAIQVSPENMYQPEGFAVGLPYPDFEQPLMSIYRDYPPILKKEASMNKFLRFG